MAFKTDCGGIALTADIKLSNAATTWNTRLSQIGRSNARVTIMTFSLSGIEYISNILSKRKNGRGITIICNDKYLHNAHELKKEFPELEIYASADAHAKIALVEPATVWLSTENFGRKSKLFEATIGIHNEQAYNHYLHQIEKVIRCRNTRKIEEDFV